MKRHYGLSLSLLALSFITPGAAFAQLVRPAVTEPSRATDRVRIENTLPPVGGESLITLPGDKGHDTSLKAGATFTLKSVSFESLTAFTSEQLREDYAPYLNKQINLATLNEIADKITARYRNAGYILSRAVVPPQRIADGNIKIRIVEGFVNKVEFQGGKVDGGILTRFADKIRNTRPLNAAALERYLLLIDDLPGVTARAVLRPSPDVPGASDVIITLTEKTIDGSVTIDNRGSRYMGPVEGSVTLNANNLLGLYDRTQIRGVSAAEPDEMRFAQIVHEEQIGSEGTRLAISGGYTHTSPGYLLEPFDVVGRDTIFSAAVTHPFLRSRQSNLFGNAQFDVRQTDLSSLSTRLYDDRLRVLRAGGSYDYVDSLSAINRFETQFSKGFNWDAGSSVNARSTTGSPVFIKGTALVSRLQPVYGPFEVYVTASGQWSANKLLAAEQFGLGGATFGSAYDPSELVGDSGIAARLELQYNQTLDFKYVPNYQLYGFYDGGVVWNRDAFASVKSSSSLTSTGLGLRFNVLEQVTGSLEFAEPLTHRVAANGADGYGPRVFFSLAYRY